MRRLTHARRGARARRGELAPRCTTPSGALEASSPTRAISSRRPRPTRRRAADLDALVAFSRSVGDAGPRPTPRSRRSSPRSTPPRAHRSSRGRRSAHDAVHVRHRARRRSGRSFDTVIVARRPRGRFPVAGATRADVRPRGARGAAFALRGQPRAPRRRATAVRDGPAPRAAAAPAHGDRRARRRERRDAVVAVRRRARRPVAATRRARRAASPSRSREATAAWRRRAPTRARRRATASRASTGCSRSASDPRRWWFQRDWSDDGAAPDGELRLSYSRLDTLENCELQFVLSSELGLDAGGGYQAWVGRLVHQLIEDCENGQVERSPAGFRPRARGAVGRGAFPLVRDLGG